MLSTKGRGGGATHSGGGEGTGKCNRKVGTGAMLGLGIIGIAGRTFLKGNV